VGLPYYDTCICLTVIYRAVAQQVVFKYSPFSISIAKQNITFPCQSKPQAWYQNCKQVLSSQHAQKLIIVVNSNTLHMQHTHTVVASSRRICVREYRENLWYCGIIASFEFIFTQATEGFTSRAVYLVVECHLVVLPFEDLFQAFSPVERHCACRTKNALS
jgi:hypothetical protein